MSEGWRKSNLEENLDMCHCAMACVDTGGLNNSRNMFRGCLGGKTWYSLEKLGKAWQYLETYLSGETSQNTFALTGETSRNNYTIGNR